ncbi:MAG: cell division protein FtsZ [Candidatus Magasanikbacteria bacterium RIFCSPHIGHO2_01_FULL_50_8]|uniref:Cell division protein FtsZ n=2 Tax=Candidatus Magasanikiibacteriota TaxID=1752731 RepID=A0A1F6LQY1_9BACT|nr:MAG: cell division protein FtsZ [Candidatus Magasanikbacteria bacterium RIFCSPHIGHO2_01_FULL_50_8]OGH67971.1 MAG: cell division protein FtsZ [Candidatus Magasanikbacteria bacterium RIFCSPHIGHO2_02_FULL_50_9b]
MPEVKPALETFAKIVVVGVGGGGTSAVNRMIEAKIRGVEFIALNTDIQALHHSLATHKINIGKTVTRGLGAGMDPETGRRAAEESQNEIRDLLKGANMVFVTAGMGGGTGSGACPVVADIAREVGALTVAVVTKPFSFEGSQRKSIADRAHEELAGRVDTIITVPNDRVMQMVDKKTTLQEAFRVIDDVLRQAVQGISELIMTHGQINVDFADVKRIMSNQGSALMGIGRASGENRAIDAAKAAISSPLLEISIDGARGILFLITGPEDLSMQEVQEAAKVVTGSADENAAIIWGLSHDNSLGEDVKITVVATGFEERRVARPETAREDQPAFRPVARPLFRQQPEPAARAESAPVRIQPQPVRPIVKDDDTSSSVATFQKKSLSSVSSRIASDDVEGAEEEEVDIPAFIRKKMNAGGS